MDYIWTPWRMKYIEKNREERDCVFCQVVECEDGPENLIFHRGAGVFMILNRYPYTNGHIMCVPFQHVSKLDALNPEVRAELMEQTTKAIGVLSSCYNPEGFNVGMNLGEIAGAGIADHLHIHIVPRWRGDTSFMSTLGETRVLPESLDETYKRVKDAWENLK